MEQNGTFQNTELMTLIFATTLLRQKTLNPKPKRRSCVAVTNYK